MGWLRYIHAKMGVLKGWHKGTHAHHNIVSRVLLLSFWPINNWWPSYVLEARQFPMLIAILHCFTLIEDDGPIWWRIFAHVQLLLIALCSCSQMKMLGYCCEYFSCVFCRYIHIRHPWHTMMYFDQSMITCLVSSSCLKSCCHYSYVVLDLVWY